MPCRRWSVSLAAAGCRRPHCLPLPRSPEHVAHTPGCRLLIWLRRAPAARRCTKGRLLRWPSCDTAGARVTVASRWLLRLGLFLAQMCGCRVHSLRACGSTVCGPSSASSELMRACVGATRCRAHHAYTCAWRRFWAHLTGVNELRRTSKFGELDFSVSLLSVVGGATPSASLPAPPHTHTHSRAHE